VEDLDEFNNVVGLEKISLFELEQELQIISLGDFVFFGDISVGHILEHLLGLLGVKGIEIVGHFAVVEVFKNKTTAWMSLGKLGQVVELVVDNNVNLVARSHQINIFY